MSFIALQTIDAIRQVNTPPLSAYEKALSYACTKEPPPYGLKSYGEIYRAAALDPRWLAETLVANALAEGDGSARLRDLSASTLSRSPKELVKAHSIDEARHARWYIAITELVFPGSIPDDMRVDLHSLMPFYKDEDFLKEHKQSPFSHEVNIDDLIQMNIAEIRTRIHQLIQRPILLAYAPQSSVERLTRLLDTLIVDETRHISYTAVLIDRMSSELGIDKTLELFAARMRDFNMITQGELSSLNFSACSNCRGCNLNKVDAVN